MFPAFESLAKRAGLWLVPLLGVGGYLWSEWSALARLGFPLDDSWIHLRFATQLASGEGLSFQTGEWVAGSTSPLWSALLALAGGSRSGVVIWAQLLGIGMLLLCVRVAFDLAIELGGRPAWGALAAILVGSTSWLLWSALSGMEVLLFTFLTLTSLRLDLREIDGGDRPPYALAVAGLATLARPEGALLLGLLVARRLAARRFRDLAIGLAAVGLILLPFAILLVTRAGSLLPTTLAAKTTTLATGSMPFLQFLHVAWGVAWKPLPVAVALAGAGAVVALARRGELAVLWLIGLPVAYAYLSHGPSPLLGNFGRYLFPLLPLVAVLGVLGAQALLDTISSRLDPVGRRMAVLVLVALLWVPAAHGAIRGAAFYAHNLADVEATDGAVARWLTENVDRRARLAVQDIGAIGFLAPQPLLDLSGIVSPRVLREVREAMSDNDPAGVEGMGRVLEREQPDYLVVFANWYPPLLAQLRVVRRFETPGNITMAHGTVVLAELPWCRYPLTPSMPPTPSTPPTVMPSPPVTPPTTQTPPPTPTP